MRFSTNKPDSRTLEAVGQSVPAREHRRRNKMDSLPLQRDLVNSAFYHCAMASAPNKSNLGKAKSNKENVRRSHHRPPQQSKGTKIIKASAPRSLFSEHQNITTIKFDAGSQDRESGRPTVLPAPFAFVRTDMAKGLTISRNGVHPPSAYDMSHHGSFSHSEASSDTSSVFGGSSLEGDDLLPEIPSISHREAGTPRLSNSFSRSTVSEDFYNHPYVTRTITNLHYGNRNGIHQPPNYGTNQSIRHSISTDQYMASAPSLRTPAAFDVEEKYDDCSQSLSCLERLSALFNPSDWLSSGIKFEEDGTPYFDDDLRWSLTGILRTLLYNPIYPEFTSLQQFSWAVLLGIVMGVYTAVWKFLIERCVLFMWKDVPEQLLEWGLFSSLDGWFPIYHYMWICPCIMGGVLSSISANLDIPIPGQNEWIHNLHSRGIQDYDTFGHIIVLSTAGMASGLCLGPELPLILTAGMIGSRLAVLCKQSMLQARVLNLTAASAAIGGFFGFPMAGALFVLEIPHRMGLQYFEALSPATIASIVAVLTNRLVTGNDVTGYYEYPFLNESLPSEIFTSAIVFGLFGGGVGMIYTKVVLHLKHRVHEMSHGVDTDHTKELIQSGSEATLSEGLPLIDSKNETPNQRLTNEGGSSRTNPLGARRTAASGALAGFLVGITCMFIPHVMFWGEAQLQTLIDKGRTPLPVFGRDEEPSAGLVALSYCVVTNTDSNTDHSGSEFTLGCSAAIALAKIFVTGLSLGTGIVGGHFWGPLFVGCAASHFLTGLVAKVSNTFGVTSNLSAYPCVALLCIMGSTHVVTFRAHIAIILMLTLTIDAFNPEGDISAGAKVAGDYSAVFPLLTVSVFVACQISHHTIFYEKQRSRGDIMASPEVLCEPGKEGSPLVMDYEGHSHGLDEEDFAFEKESDTEIKDNSGAPPDTYVSMNHGAISRNEIEANFEAKTKVFRRASQSPLDSLSGRAPNPLPPRPHDRASKNTPTNEKAKKNLRILDNLLKESIANAPGTRNLGVSHDFFDGPIQKVQCEKKSHRRTKSEPIEIEEIIDNGRSTWNKKPENGGHQRRPSLKRVDSFGQVDQELPSLLDQARRRCASFATAETNQKLKQKVATKPVRKNSH